MEMLTGSSALWVLGQAKSTICETISYKRKHKVILFYCIPNHSMILLQLIAEISWCTVWQYLLSPVDVFVWSALKFVLNAFIYQILFSVFLFKPSLFSIQSATQSRRFENKNKTNFWRNEFTFEVENNCGNEIERKEWGNLLEDKNMYNLEEKPPFS